MLTLMGYSYDLKPIKWKLTVFIFIIRITYYLFSFLYNVEYFYLLFLHKIMMKHNLPMLTRKVSIGHRYSTLQRYKHTSIIYTNHFLYQNHLKCHCSYKDIKILQTLPILLYHKINWYFDRRTCQRLPAYPNNCLVRCLRRDNTTQNSRK